MPVRVKASVAAKYYGISLSNLRKLAREGSIVTDKTPKGHYLYHIPKPEPDIPDSDGWSENVIYARVSSRKQQEDLARQVKSLKERFPTFTVVKDVGSGINYRRTGFRSILERLFQGNIKRVVVAYQDRFARFGFDFFQWLFAEFGAVLESVEQPEPDTGDDMVEDIMEIFTVFSARYYGKRKYHNRKEVQDIS